MRELRNVLLVDDEESDRFFVVRSFELFCSKCRLGVVHNAQEAIDYIVGSEPYSDRERYPFPELILTDWNMPVAGGLELLEWLREHPRYSVMPVVVLTSSDEEQDVKAAYCAGATAYLLKPATQERLAEIIRDFVQFWSHVKRPQVDIHTPCETAKVRAS